MTKQLSRRRSLSKSKFFTLVLVSFFYLASASSSIAANSPAPTGQAVLSFYQQMSNPWGGLSEIQQGPEGGSFIAYLPSCDVELTFTCIESVSVQNGDSWIKLLPQQRTVEESTETAINALEPIVAFNTKGEKVIYSRKNSTWSGIAGTSLPSGAVPPRWVYGDIKLIVYASILGTYQGVFDSGEKYKTNEFIINVSPDYIKFRPQKQLIDGRIKVVILNRQQLDILKNYLSGRMGNGELAFLDGNRIQIVGNTVRVSTISTVRWQMTELPAEVKEIFNRFLSGTTMSSPKDWNSNTKSFGYSCGGHTSVSEICLASFSELEKFFDPESMRESLNWSLESAGGSYLSSSGNYCRSKTGPAGMTTSNATIFSGSIPKWHPKEQRIDFFLASPHKDANGNLNLGNLDLSIEVNFAKCLWGLSEIPSSVAISITYADEVSQLGTAILTTENNYVHFHVKDFHFSSPKISFQFPVQKQELPVSTVTPSTTASKSAFVTRSKKISTTVYCVKGKLVKKISGYAPRCPKGYSKK